MTFTTPTYESLQAKFGYTPMRVDYIIVVTPRLADKITRIGKLAPHIIIEKLCVFPYTDNFYLPGRWPKVMGVEDRCVCLIQSQKPSLQGPSDRGTPLQNDIGSQILRNAHIIINLVDGKLTYIKDRLGTTTGTSPAQLMQVFQADLNKWNKSTN
jgi:hypothetical protein